METQSYQKTKDKIATDNPHTSIITLNMSTKLTNKKTVAGCILKKPNYMLPSGDTCAAVKTNLDSKWQGKKYSKQVASRGKSV